jgi:hypothetical protein
MDMAACSSLVTWRSCSLCAAPGTAGCISGATQQAAVTPAVHQLCSSSGLLQRRVDVGSAVCKLQNRMHTSILLIMGMQVHER